MHVSRTSSKLLSHTALLAGALFAAACGGVTQFQGQTALNVAGTPPAPPPPPPPPPKVEPPPPPSRVEVRDNKIEIKEKIQFEVNKATILPQSFSLMDEIADTVKKNPHIKKIAIEGHASSEGDATHNTKLSDERAKSVMKYIVDKGVDAGRLTAKGFGSSKPLENDKSGDKAKDEAAREKNRRVEFVIVEQDVTQKKIEVDHLGKEKVLEEKKMVEKKEEPAASDDAKKAEPKKAEPKKAEPKKAEPKKADAAAPKPLPSLKKPATDKK